MAHDIFYQIVIALQVHYPPLYVCLWAPTIVLSIDRHSIRDIKDIRDIVRNIKLLWKFHINPILWDLYEIFITIYLK